MFCKRILHIDEERVFVELYVQAEILFSFILLETVRANYQIRYGTKSGTSVPDPVHPIPQCIGQTLIISNF